MALATVTVNMTIVSGGGRYVNVILPGTYPTVESVPVDQTTTDDLKTVGGMKYFPTYVKGNIYGLIGTLNMAAAIGGSSIITSINPVQARFRITMNYGLDAYTALPDTNGDGIPDYSSLEESWTQAMYELDGSFTDQYGNYWDTLTYTGTAAIDYRSYPTTVPGSGGTTFFSGSTQTPVQWYGAGGGWPNVGSVPVSFVGRLFDNHRYAAPDGLGMALGYDIVSAAVYPTPNYGGRTGHINISGGSLALDFEIYYIPAGTGTVPPGGTAQLMGANGLDITLDQRQYKGYSQSGTVVIARATDLLGTAWRVRSTAIAGDQVALRADKLRGNQPLVFAVRTPGSAIVAYKTLDEGITNTLMGTVFASGAMPALCITRDGRQCFYARVGSAILGVIRDPVGGTMAGPFTAVASGVDSDGLSVAEYTTGGGVNMIKMTYVSAGAIVDKSSVDGKAFT